MFQRWIVVVWVLTLILLPSISLSAVNAETINLSLAGSVVTVHMNLQLQENLTALPLINAHVGPSNTTDVLRSFTQPLNEAIQSSVPEASLSSLELSVETSNNTGVWTLSENYTMTIVGADTNSGSHITSNLSFISMNVTKPIRVGGTELNFVGPTLILPALEARVAQYPNLQYYIDGSTPTSAVIPEQTTSAFTLLDFTWVAPIRTWTSNQNFLGQSTSWTLDPTFSQYNLTIGRPSPECLQKTACPLIPPVFVCTYNPSLSISVPANAWVNGNTVYFDTATPTEAVMPLIVAISVIIAVAAMILDRKLTGPLRLRKKR